MTQSSVTPPVHPRYFDLHWSWWFTVAVLVLMAGVRLHLLDFPLERDEGEYAYAGQLMLQGIPPYELAYNMKFPGTYAAYACIMAVFGQTPTGIHFGVMIVTTSIALMVYWLGKRIFDPIAGMVAATTYAILAANTALFGLAGHATHFAAFFATAGLCLMWKARQSAQWQTVGVAGVMLGLAMLMKQHAAIIGAWAFGIFAWEIFFKKNGIKTRSLKNLLAFCVGTTLPLGLCFFVLWCMWVFNQFWFWTIVYARQYVSIVSIHEMGSQLLWSLRSMASEDFLLWLPCLAGFGMTWLDDRLKQTRHWLLGFSLASFLTTIPGFYFRTHYFLLALPALGLLAGCAVSGASHLWNQKNGITKFSQWPVALYIAIVALTVIKTSDVWSVLGKRGNHALYGIEPFAEAEVVAAFIRNNTKPDAKIAVLGSEPEIYFLSQRHSATGYIYAYPLMEPQPFASLMQDKMIHEIETNTPEFIVFVNLNSSWAQVPQSDVTVFKWWDTYQTNYMLVGLANIPSSMETVYVWGSEKTKHYEDTRECSLKIYQRKNAENPL